MLNNAQYIVFSIFIAYKLPKVSEFELYQSFLKETLRGEYNFNYGLGPPKLGGGVGS